ncbi:hypothetical protein [Streptosporangium sp. NPDC002721]|uniref:hypothetical protein n=1 Tax=Streptosporangium sp. NPDC002721 TaxID=3366188 RepID=UPI0036B061F9
MPPTTRTGPPAPHDSRWTASFLAWPAALVLGVVAGLLHHRQGDFPEAYLVAESFFFRFAFFLAAVACGRAASGVRQAVAAGLLLALGTHAATTMVELLRGVPTDYALVQDLPDAVMHLLWTVALPLTGVLLACLTRREDLRGDLAAAALVQGQTIPAVVSLEQAARIEGCCVPVEWGYPWQDWIGLALSVALVVLLRPAPGARLRSLVAAVALTGLIVGVSTIPRWF